MENPDLSARTDGVQLPPANRKAVASIILGIGSIAIFFIGMGVASSTRDEKQTFADVLLLMLLTSVTGTSLAITALLESRTRPERFRSRWLCIAGLCASAAALIFALYLFSTPQQWRDLQLPSTQGDRTPF